MVADHQGCQYQRRVIVRGKIIRTRNLKPGEPRDLLMAVKQMVDEIAAAADAIAANSSQLHYSCKTPLHKEELLANSRFLARGLVLALRVGALGEERPQGIFTDAYWARRAVSFVEQRHHSRYSYRRYCERRKMGEPKQLLPGCSFLWRSARFRSHRADWRPGFLDCLGRRF